MGKSLKKKSRLQLEALFHDMVKQDIQRKKDQMEFVRYQREIENHEHDPFAGHVSIQSMRTGLEDAEKEGIRKRNEMLSDWIKRGRRLKHMEIL